MINNTIKDIKIINEYIISRINLLNYYEKKLNDNFEYRYFRLYEKDPYYYSIQDYVNDIESLKVLYNGIYNYRLPYQITEIFRKI